MVKSAEHSRSRLMRRLLYGVLAIRLFTDKATELVWNEQYARSLDRRPRRAAVRKLEQPTRLGA